MNDDITSLEGSINLQEKNIQLIKWLSCKNYSSLLKIWLVLRDLDVPDFFARKGGIEGAFPGVGGSSRVAAVTARSAGF